MRAKKVGVLGGLCAAASVMAIAAYQFGRSNLLKYDGQQTREAVLARIPLGTSISSAKNVMAAEGFQCTMLYNSIFAEDRPGGGQQIHHPPADILWCDSGERITAALVISKRWQVVFVDEQGAVSYVGVSVGLTGP